LFVESRGLDCEV